MNFSEVLTKDFLLSYEGRINRQRFWAFFLVYLGIAIAAAIVDGIVGGSLFGIVTTLALLYPSICVSIKRWHDRDKSGWWILINLLPLIGVIWALVENGFLAGTSGSNRFGSDPLGSSSSVAA